MSALHINELVTPTVRKQWIIDYVNSHEEIGFGTPQEEKFNELRPEFVLRIRGTKEEVEDIKNTFMSDMNEFVKNSIKDEDITEDIKGNIFVIASFGDIDNNHNLVRVELMV